MPRRDSADEYCSVSRTLGILGDRWTLLVIREAFNGVRRFEDFRRLLGIARNILTDRLQRLVDAEILQTRRYQDHPVRHEYRLTERGRELTPILLTLMAWGDRWLDEPGAGPPNLVRHTPCGHDIVPQLRCPDCGEPVDAFNVRTRPGPGMPAEIAEARQRMLEEIIARRQRG